MIQILPAIDIIDGRCVRLTRGDYAQKKVYDASPVDMAARYADCGVSRIHLVDLDGARLSSPANLAVLEQIASRGEVETEWGGGIADDDALQSVFNAGATKAIIGSVAALSPARFRNWLERFGGGRLILGADLRDGKVAVKGWQESAGMGASELIGSFEGLEEVICTEISRDGMLGGPAIGLYKALQAEFPTLAFTASGGISNMDDIRALDALGMPRAIVGKAIYENRISLNDIKLWLQSA
ncbi:MAG: 1-(5-phosphoribosyl)-5-[Bacteroidales bacterium]|nr:1-(5-phosphoribosyl)-5-[(5-phosphoribosylamino)methylideneamino] imidazole-4-carboxamide isomerase [Bacteroidales bacterium]